jgi:hypothetical protein
MSINTHGTIPHCKSLLALRRIFCAFDCVARPPLHSRLDRPSVELPAGAVRQLVADELMKDKPMELILIVVLLVVLFGGGFGFYRGGYYRQGGPVGIGGILGLILVVLVIGWLVHGHIGGLSL